VAGDLSDVVVNLQALEGRGPAVAVAAATAMGALMVAETMNTLSSTSSSPSEPGTPPAIVTGQLRRSVKAEPAEVSGTSASVTVGATTVYARIQELGGDAGVDHSAHLPPRPYLAPTIERIRPALHDVAVAAAAAVLGA